MSPAGCSRPERRCARARIGTFSKPLWVGPRKPRSASAEAMPSPTVLRLLLLLFLANGTPVMVKRILGNRWSYPLDGGHEFVDGRPLFGRSKTIRGVTLA